MWESSVKLAGRSLNAARCSSREITPIGAAERMLIKERTSSPADHDASRRSDILPIEGVNGRILPVSLTRNASAIP